MPSPLAGVIKVGLAGSARCSDGAAAMALKVVGVKELRAKLRSLRA